MSTGILLLTDELDVAGFTDRAKALDYDSLWLLNSGPSTRSSRSRGQPNTPTRCSWGLDSPAGAVRDQFDVLAGLNVVDEPLVVIPNGVSQPMETRTVETLGPDA
jgi:hypothetical protein